MKSHICRKSTTHYLWTLSDAKEGSIAKIFQIFEEQLQVRSEQSATVWSWSKLSLLFRHLLKKGRPFPSLTLFSSLVWHFVVNSFQIDCLKSRFTELVIYLHFYGQSNSFSHTLTPLWLFYCSHCFCHCNFPYPYIMATSSPNKFTPAVMEGK